MAVYVDEEDIWKCPKHPSKRRRTGICHHCLRERLSLLCPNCATERPCPCYATASSSSSSSFSRFSAASDVGTVGRVSTLIESEPSFRRSRSLAIPFLRSKPSVDQDSSSSTYAAKSSSSSSSATAASSASSFWLRFKSRSKRYEAEDRNDVVFEEVAARKSICVVEEAERWRMMRKSRSVAVTSGSGVADVRPSSKSGKGWHFPSPIKVFRQSISRGLVLERSPLYRG